MNVTTAAGVATLDDKVVIQKITGRLIKLYDRSSGIGENGEWSHQNGVLEDGTGQVTVHFKNREPVPKSLRGQVIAITATEGKKGWNGVYTEEHEYEGTVSMQVKVTPTGNVSAVGAEAEPEEYDQESPAKPEQPSVAKNATTKPTGAGNGLPTTGQMLESAEKAMLLSLESAKRIKTSYETLFDVAMSEEQFASVTAQVFKLLDNHGLINSA